MPRNTNEIRIGMYAKGMDDVERKTLRIVPVAMAAALIFAGAICGVGSVLPNSVKNLLPEVVRETITPVTARATTYQDGNWEYRLNCSKLQNLNLLGGNQNLNNIEVENCEKIKKVVNPFADVKEGSWYYKAVMALYSKGMIAGTDETHFSPDMTTTRSQIVQMLYRMAGSAEPAKTGIFTDVTDQWFAKAVNWAGGTGLVSGTGDGRFDPDGTLTREQLAVILYNAVKLLPDALSVSNVTTGKDDLSAFADGSDVSAWAKKQVAWAVEKGLITGIREGETTLLAPQGECTRSQLVVMLTHCLEDSNIEPEDEPHLDGGWGIVDNKAVTLPGEVQTGFSKIAQGENKGLVPIALVAQQVVAGTNDMILCKDGSKYRMIVVYRDLQGGAELKGSTKFILTDYTLGEGNVNTEQLSGGWYVPEELTTLPLTNGAQEAFDKAIEGFVGSTIEPMALIGSQVVAGTNYAILCRVTLTTPEAVPTVQVVRIFADFEGNAEITGFRTINPADYNR